MSIQPADKAVERLVNSYDWYWRRKQKQSILILSTKGGGGGGGGALAQTVESAAGRRK